LKANEYRKGFVLKGYLGQYLGPSRGCSMGLAPRSLSWSEGVVIKAAIGFWEGSDSVAQPPLASPPFPYLNVF
jgi:hypothetical protein